MKSVRNGWFNLIKDGVGDIPVLILGPPEVFIPTIPDELKRYCVFFGINYPFKVSSEDKELLPEKYQLHNWRSIDDVSRFYRDIGVHFCNELKQKKFIVIGPSMMSVLADHICYTYPNDVMAACFLSPAQTIQATTLDTQFAKNFGAAIKDGREIANFHFYLDMLHQEASKDFNDIETFRPIWIELWRKGTDNVQTQMVLMSILGGHLIGKSNLPSLIIAGETDGRFSIEHVKAFRLPLNYKRVILPGGHLTHFEYHSEFADVFTGWLEELQLKASEPKIADRTIELRKSNAKLKAEIERRKIIESDLRESRERYKTLSSIAPVGIFRFHVSGKFIDKNKVFSKLTGLNKQNISLDDFIGSIKSSNANSIKQSINKMREKGGPCRFECQFGSTEKHWILCHILKEVINDDIFYIGTLTDLTKRREAEELAYRHQSELAHYARLSTVSEMVSGITHEIAQPLSSISQYACALSNLMRDSQLTSTKHESILHKIEAQADRAGLVLQRIKNFIIRKEIKKERVLISDILFDIKELLHFALEKNYIQLDISIDEQYGPLSIFVDNIQIQQVILNIIKNAIEAMDEVDVHNRKILIKVQKQQKNTVIITITDNGNGIHQEHLHSIFDPFYTTKEKGTGVGLSISNTIIKAHGGSISVLSEINQGTTFSIELPQHGLVEEKSL